MSRTVTCTHHCSACGRHFHSLAAYDLHRLGVCRSSDSGDARCCASAADLLDRDGNERLVVLTCSGECRMYDDGSGVRVKRE